MEDNDCVTTKRNSGQHITACSIASRTAGYRTTARRTTTYCITVYQKAGIMTNPNPSQKRLSVEEARALVLGNIAPLPPEQVSLLESCGRILAQDVVSDIDISPFDNSAMDGFAVCFADFETAQPSPESPLTLKIVGLTGAGELYGHTLEPGEALRIMTGAPLPQGADTVVKLEDVDVQGITKDCPQGTKAVFTSMPKPAQHVRFRGEEAHKGDVLIGIGQRVNPAGTGLMASTGNTRVLVYGRPRVAIISTGSELVEANKVPGPGQIRNSNSYMLAAAVLEAGGVPVILNSVADNLSALRKAFLAATRDHHFLITSGGAAGGDFDFITQIVQELGQLLFNQVNMKPGKAQIFGLINGTPVLGLPGNPGAAATGFEVLARPALRKMQGSTALDRPVTQAVLTVDTPAEGPRRGYLRARLEHDDNGSYRVTPAPNQSSALLGALSRSNCLLVLPEGGGTLTAGTVVDCLRIDLQEGAL